MSGFAAPRDAADAIVDEILRRRLAGEDARRQDRRLRARQDNPWPGRQDVVLRIEAEAVEERGLLLALAHLLDGEGDPEAYVHLNHPLAGSGAD
ncbi:hypothetical protein [Streptomyces sp. 62]|uniref:hypothetical protein n=1 Tax=Streptomyces sp. NPDC012756 TaxID=3364847 RepID=UPI000E237775